MSHITSMDFDIAVVGLGAMGSASVHALAARGARVIGFDRLTTPHAHGSTHGHTRIIREAYYEHPLYVPLVRRAYDRWAELERECGEKLFLQTGGLTVGPETGSLFRGALESTGLHDIEHEILDACSLRDRFPAYRPRADWVGLHEHRAGMLFPERCVDALLAGARKTGATLRLEEPVLGWRRNGRGVRLQTGSATYDVDRLIIAAGPWLPELSESVGMPLPLEIERQLSHWFAPADGATARYQAAHCPVGLWQTTDGGEVFATLPDEGHGVKCGMHHAGATTSPSTVDRTVSPEENEAARRMLEQVMPGAGGRLIASRVCLYTNTPDRHFLVDWVSNERVLIVSACSGHGFKFASAIGEIVAQLALDNHSWLDLTPFSLSRFG